MVQSPLANISKYLTETEIEKAFKRKTNSDDVVKSVKLTRAAPAGVGLLSVVYRVHVEGHRHSAKFIAKGLVNDQLLRKSLNCTKYFERETYFFTDVLPTLSEFQESTGAKERIQNNLPICYGHFYNGTDDYILIEDLAETNCISGSEHPTVEERDENLKVLAHLHAVSLALRVLKPDIFEKLANKMPEIYFNDENREWYAKYLNSALDIDKTIIAEYENPKSIYYKKFFDLVDGDFYAELCKIVNAKGDNPVINHGDAWSPNFLLSKERAVAIDFQLVRCASPATDLAYYILLCTNLCKNKSDFMQAVEVYYNALEFYLKDMSIDASKVFSRDTLQKELVKYGQFGIMATLTSIPLQCSEKCDNLRTFDDHSEFEKIPLEKLWVLTPIKEEENKMCLVRVLHTAVDVGLI